MSYDDDDYIQLEEDHIEVLTGLLHSCPICLGQLSLRSMPGLDEEHWHCKSCGAEWKVGDLIAALNYNELKEA